MVRAANVRNTPFTFENIFSMGVRSGPHGGKSGTRALTRPTAATT